MTQADSVHSTPPINTSAELPKPSQETLAARLATEAKRRERRLRRVAKLRKRAADEIERLIGFLDASDPYAATELEDQIDDEPCDTDELDGPENGEDEESDPAEPSLGSVGDMHFDQTRWASGGRRDLESDGAESGIADEDGLDEQIPFRDWQNVGMV